MSHHKHSLSSPVADIELGPEFNLECKNLSMDSPDKESRPDDSSNLAHSFKDFAAWHQADITEDFDLDELAKLKTWIVISDQTCDFDMKDPIFYMHKPVTKAEYKDSSTCMTCGTDTEHA